MRIKFNPFTFTVRRKKRQRKRRDTPPEPPTPPNPYNADDFKNNYESDFRKNYLGEDGLTEDVVNRYREQQRADRGEGRQYADEFFEKYGNEGGLNPQQKLALQEGANREINRNLQSQNRLFLGRQGGYGVRGGVNFAQQNELARNANDSRLKSENDIRNMDEELKLRRMAARFGIEQGFAGQGMYNRQSAEDLLNQYRRRLQEQQETEKFSRMFQM